MKELIQLQEKTNKQLSRVKKSLTYTVSELLQQINKKYICHNVTIMQADGQKWGYQYLICINLCLGPDIKELLYYKSYKDTLIYEKRKGCIKFCCYISIFDTIVDEPLRKQRATQAYELINKNIKNIIKTKKVLLYP